MKNIFFSVVVLITLAACSKTEVKEPLEYTGPLSEAENVELFYTEKDLIKIKMNAALVYDFKTGDKEFPKGLYMEFYDEFGKLESTLKANHAYFFADQKLWRGQGKVEVRNVSKNEQLNTEELFWKQDDQKIYTDKFVTIRQQGDVIYGEGLDAKQDLSEYTITKIHGTFHLEE
jgi:LPS export ABC transporter protein LptC